MTTIRTITSLAELKTALDHPANEYSVVHYEQGDAVYHVISGTLNDRSNVNYQCFIQTEDVPFYGGKVTVNTYCNIYAYNEEALKRLPDVVEKIEKLFGWTDGSYKHPNPMPDWCVGALYCPHCKPFVDQGQIPVSDKQWTAWYDRHEKEIKVRQAKDHFRLHYQHPPKDA